MMGFTSLLFSFHAVKCLRTELGHYWTRCSYYCVEFLPLFLQRTRTRLKNATLTTTASRPR